VVSGEVWVSVIAASPVQALLVARHSAGDKGLSAVFFRTGGLVA
jgi:hypothetical protein